tara:strand:+ start:130 stop:1749 length:1620 start_codon:yes stop_codon:yes gene_type:complete
LSESFDVVVIGGGPSGSCAASMAAKAGLSVVLLERDKFPREHVGESLLPASMPILRELGVEAEIAAAGFPVKYGATMVWGSGSEPWTWRFSETNQEYTSAYQVNRPEFDTIILNRARALGVDVREETQVIEVIFQDDRAVGVSCRKRLEDHFFIESGMVIDCSGQSSLISRARNLRQWDDSFQNLAIYGYFENAVSLPKPNENNIFIESFSEGWIWNIPLKGNIASVGIVLDSQKASKELQSRDVEDYFQANLSYAKESRRMLQSAKLLRPPKIVKDWSYTSTQMAGLSWVLAGDAACFIDPLFSSGVHMALMSGVLASAYAVTALSDPDMEIATAKVYEEMIRREYSLFRELAQLFYQTNRSIDSYFWEARKILDQNGTSTGREAFIKAVSGQSVRGYERAVLEKGELPQSFRYALESQQNLRHSRQRELGMYFNNWENLVPYLHEDTYVARKPVLSAGRFEWGLVLHSPERKEGTDCSSFVALLLDLIDGEATMCLISERLRDKVDSPNKIVINEYLKKTVEILYVEGAISRLRLVK